MVNAPKIVIKVAGGHFPGIQGALARMIGRSSRFYSPSSWIYLRQQFFFGSSTFPLHFHGMKNVGSIIGRYMLTRTAWMFFAGIWLAAVILVLQEDQHQWALLFTYVGRLSLLFAPVLAYGLWRHRIADKLPVIYHLLLSVVLFIAYPVLIDAMDWQRFIARPDLDIVAVRIAALWFVMTELVLLIHPILSRQLPRLRLFRRFRLETGIRLLLILLALQYTFLVFYVFDQPALAEATIFTFISYTIQVFIIFFIYYGFYWINHYWLINKLLQRRGLVYYLFGLVTVVLTLSPVAAQLIAYLPLVRDTDIHPAHTGQIFEDIHFIIPFFGMVLSIPFILAVKWWRQQRQLAALAREKTAQELSMLRQQINPHFFFNTLNNLYAMSITQDSRTPEVILQLSELMRYVIYKGKEESVTLAEEISYIEDYVQLQQIRLHNSLDLRITKEIADEQLRIPPLLFITFVENAFKHGIEAAEGDSFLHLHFHSTDELMEFRCENSVETYTSGGAGIGLQNLRRRLEILYPDRYTLELDQQAGRFSALLSIALTSAAISSPQPVIP